MVSMVLEEFVPASAKFHLILLKWSAHAHRFQSYSEPEGMYENTYFNKNGSVSRDSTTAFSIKNIFGIALLEGFNKYAKAGLTAYISHKFSRYDLDECRFFMTVDRFTEQEIFVGGELLNDKVKSPSLFIDGEIGIMDKALGQFRVHGNMDLNFRLGKDTVNLIARGFVTNIPSIFSYAALSPNHISWDTTYGERNSKFRVEGELNIESLGY